MAVHHHVWRPISKIGSNGVFAMEANAFEALFCRSGCRKVDICDSAESMVKKG